MITRRHFLRTSFAAALPFTNSARAQDPASQWTRRELSDPQSSLESYKKAVTAMLGKDPSDPHNWYRNAFIHIIDCPHGNWWFLPWHRGYLGWFERTCRALSGDPQFALPYWDWTTNPKLPAQFFGNVLDPTNSLFKRSQAEFEAAFKDPTSELWKSFNKDQIAQLTARGLVDPADPTNSDSLWQMILDSYPANSARAVNAGYTLPKTIVGPGVLSSALSFQAFANYSGHPGFGSDPATRHSDELGKSPLESIPHDNVHGIIDAFMGRFLSPVDPIFFMHHCNLDRLWDVWARRQTAAGRSPFPDNIIVPSIDPNRTLLDIWNSEPFLFYVDDQGRTPVETAKDSATIGKFAYNYSKGFGDEMVQQPAPPVLAALGGIQPAALEGKTPGLLMAKAKLMLPKAMDAAVDTTERHLFARITFAPGIIKSGSVFQLRANADRVTDEPLQENDPAVLAVLRPFVGSHKGLGNKPTSFTVPISEGLRGLKKGGNLPEAEALNLQVTGVANGKAIDVKVDSIVVYAQ